MAGNYRSSNRSVGKSVGGALRSVNRVGVNEQKRQKDRAESKSDMEERRAKGQADRIAIIREKESQKRRTISHSVKKRTEAQGLTIKLKNEQKRKTASHIVKKTVEREKGVQQARTEGTLSRRNTSKQEPKTRKKVAKENKW